MKEWILKIAVGIILVNGLGELALTQIHVLAITKLFVNEIGLYLFMFIIFGITATFNALSLEKRQSIIFFAVSCWITAVFGFIYLRLLQADVAGQDTLTMADVQTSWLLIIISIGIYLVGSVVIPWLSWGNIKTLEF